MNKNLINAIDKTGIQYRPITMMDGRNGIMLDTNYSGQYPKKETWDKIYTIEQIMKRYKAYEYESRGCYTGILILPKKDQ